jgi:microcystin-dependent protein
METFIGMIAMFGFNFAPRDWAFCAGAILPIGQNTTLFSLLGTTYGGDGRVTFALPDLRGRSPMAPGRHPGSLYDWRLGQKAGAETHTMTIQEMAAHTHDAAFTPDGSGGAASGTLTAKSGGAGSPNPTTGDFISGGGNSAIFGTGGGFGTTDVELDGLTITGGGGGGSVVVDVTGASRQFSIIQPVLTVNCCISMLGIYPARS